MFQHVHHAGSVHNHIAVLQQRKINHVDDAVRALHIRSVYLDPAVIEQDRISYMCHIESEKGEEEERENVGTIKSTFKLPKCTAALN